MLILTIRKHRGLFLGLALILSGPLLAQELPLPSTPVVEDAEPQSTLNWFDHFVVKGGVISFLIIALSVTSTALIIEHSLSIRRSRIVGVGQAGHVKELLDQRRYADALEYTSADPTMLCYVVNAGLLAAEQGYVAMERAVEEALEDRAARLFRKTEYLNIVGTVGPMLGLFGTVYGMIELFAKIRAVGRIPEPGLIADSLSIAMVTTFWGLIVAIPSMAAFGYFRNRIDELSADCAVATDRLLGVFKPTTKAKAPVLPTMGGLAAVPESRLAGLDPVAGARA